MTGHDPDYPVYTRQAPPRPPGVERGARIILWVVLTPIVLAALVCLVAVVTGIGA